MLENEKERRWWFANHPEYSNSRKRARDNQDDDGHDDQETVSPESVDAYVDEALKHVRGTVAALLKSFKRNFGTQAEDQQNKAKSAAPTSVDQTSHAKYRVSGLRKYSNEELRRMGIPTPEEQALVSDPHTFLDATPYKRYITSPVQTLKRLFRSKAEDAIVYGAKKGRDRSGFSSQPSDAGPVTAPISRKKYPEAARHAEEAQAAGQPSELTIERTGAKVRGREALRGYPAEAAKDRDEYPPRMFRESGTGASVKTISPSDNRGAGASIGNRLRKHPDGTKVKIEVVE